MPYDTHHVARAGGGLDDEALLVQLLQDVPDDLAHALVWLLGWDWVGLFFLGLVHVSTGHTYIRSIKRAHIYTHKINRNRIPAAP